MKLKNEIRRLIADRKKELKDREKTAWMHCKVHLGEVKTGPVGAINLWEKDWHRRHDEHNKQSFLRKVVSKIWK